MVERGTARARDIVQLEFLLGDALALPFDDGRFGAATIAFGLGALADPTAGCASSAASSGQAAGSCASSRRCRGRAGGAGIQHRTARRLAPLAVSVTARRDAYRRLDALVRNVPDADTLADLMRASGLVDVRLPPARARRRRAPRRDVPPG